MAFLRLLQLMVVSSQGNLIASVNDTCSARAHKSDHGTEKPKFVTIALAFFFALVWFSASRCERGENLEHFPK